MPNDVARSHYTPTFVRPHQAKQQALVRIIDSCIVLMSLWLAMFLLGYFWPGKYDWNDLYLTYGFSGLLMYQFFAEYNEVYFNWRGSPLSTQLFRISSAWLLTLLTVILMFFFIKATAYTSRLAIGIWSVTTPLLLCLFHASHYYLSWIAGPAEGQAYAVGIVGANPLGHRLADTFVNMPSLGYRFLGYYDDRKVQKLTGFRRL